MSQSKQALAVLYAGVSSEWALSRLSTDVAIGDSITHGYRVLSAAEGPDSWVNRR